tara:strand:+ start:125 stop:244 length:120 start_codon:yes stop_codon:yes gene_type:complete
VIPGRAIWFDASLQKFVVSFDGITAGIFDTFAAAMDYEL